MLKLKLCHESISLLDKNAHFHLSIEGLRLVLDVVPNHSSTDHPWFVNSRQRKDPYTDYYVWHPGHILENKTRVPPSNWVCMYREYLTETVYCYPLY